MGKCSLNWHYATMLTTLTTKQWSLILFWLICDLSVCLCFCYLRLHVRAHYHTHSSFWMCCNDFLFPIWLMVLRRNLILIRPHNHLLLQISELFVCSQRFKHGYVVMLSVFRYSFPFLGFLCNTWRVLNPYPSMW